MRKRRPPLLMQLDKLVSEQEGLRLFYAMPHLDLLKLTRRTLNNLRIYDFTKKRPRPKTL